MSRQPHGRGRGRRERASAARSRAGVDDDVDPETREEIVRITREGITNAINRGGAQHITVELGSRVNGVLLRITDDGCGIGEPAADAGRGTGLGLPAMRARAASVGGRLIARRRPAGGTELDVLVS